MLSSSDSSVFFILYVNIKLITFLSGSLLKLIELIKDNDLRRKLGNQGRKVTLKEFDIEILSNKLADIIERVYN